MSIREAWSCSGERVFSDVAGVVGATSTTGMGDASPSGSSSGLAISSSNLSAASFTFSRSWSEKLCEDKNKRKSLERALTPHEADAIAVGAAVCWLEAEPDGFLPASVFKIAITAASMPSPARASVSWRSALAATGAFLPPLVFKIEAVTDSMPASLQSALPTDMVATGIAFLSN